MDLVLCWWTYIITRKQRITFLVSSFTLFYRNERFDRPLFGLYIVADTYSMCKFLLSKDALKAHKWKGCCSTEVLKVFYSSKNICESQNWMLLIPSSLVRWAVQKESTPQDCTRSSEFSLHRDTEHKAACIFSDKVFSVSWRGPAFGCCYLMAHLKSESHVIEKNNKILTCCKHTKHFLLTFLP